MLPPSPPVSQKLCRTAPTPWRAPPTRPLHMLPLCWALPRRLPSSPLASSSSLLKGHLSLREPQPPPPSRLHLCSASHCLVWHPEARTLPAAPNRVRRAQTPGDCAVCHTDPRSVQRDPGRAGTGLQEMVSALGQGMVGFRSHRDWNPPELTTSMQKTHENTTQNCLETGFPKATGSSSTPQHNLQRLEGRGPSGRALPPLPQGAQRAESRYLESGPQPGLFPRLFREIRQPIPA